MNRDFLYILRFTIQPGCCDEERIEQLISFCRQARIDDVMFFIDCEELNTGFITKEEARPWLDVISRAKERLEPLGITTSINPWVTLVHADRGRSLREGQNFNRMVDVEGNMAKVQACPLCEEWRKYITELYAYYATIKPNMIWVEDDFRFHNHSPLVWGGCFCEKHMEEYSRRAGKKLTREEFVEGILKPGKPHPYRKIWLDTCRETLVDIAEAIGKAVHEVSPSTRVGLMSSVPAVHCAEGRDWNGILKGLARNTPPVNRPHLPAYSETTPQEYLWDFNKVSRMTREILPDNTEVYPEMDNFPFSRFSSSRSFTRFQVETSAFLDAEGITLSLFNMMGTGVIMSEGYQKELAESKDFLNSIKALGLKQKFQQGVKVLYSPESSYTLHTFEGKSMTELYPDETFWASLLSCYGIANTFSDSKEHSGSTVAVSGQYFRNLSAHEIEKLFESNFVILNGDAAYTLADMGLGHLAGISDVAWHGADSGFQAYEQVCNGKSYCGVPLARSTAQFDLGSFLEIKYLENPELITEVRNPYGKVVCPGITIYKDRVLILPYGRISTRHLAHLNPIKQAIFQDVLKNAKGGPRIFVEGVPYVLPCIYDMGCVSVLLLGNFSNDGHDEIRLYAPDIPERFVTEINRKQPGGVRADMVRDGEYIILRSGLRRLETKAFVWENRYALK